MPRFSKTYERDRRKSLRERDAMMREEGLDPASKADRDTYFRNTMREIDEQIARNRAAREITT